MFRRVRLVSIVLATSDTFDQICCVIKLCCMLYKNIYSQRDDLHVLKHPPNTQNQAQHRSSFFNFTGACETNFVLFICPKSHPFLTFSALFCQRQRPACYKTRQKMIFIKCFQTSVKFTLTVFLKQPVSNYFKALG